MTKQTIVNVVVFLAIACAVSFGCSKLPSYVFYQVDIKDVLCGFGPLISGLLCYKIFKTNTNYSIAGVQPTKAWLIVLLPAITFLCTNTKQTIAFNMAFVLSQIVYCFGEEFGWRHYLQSATNGLSKWLQLSVIGIVWFIWHFSWLQHPIQAMIGSQTSAPFAVAVVIAIVMLVLFSAFLKWAVDQSKSILLPTMAHFVLKTNGITAMVTLCVVVVALLTWNKFTLDKK